jgi:hypothetical protein
MNKIKFSRSEIADNDFRFDLKDACQISGPWAACGPFILFWRCVKRFKTRHDKPKG